MPVRRPARAKPDAPDRALRIRRRRAPGDGDGSGSRFVRRTGARRAGASRPPTQSFAAPARDRSSAAAGALRGARVRCTARLAAPTDGVGKEQERRALHAGIGDPARDGDGRRGRRVRSRRARSSRSMLERRRSTTSTSSGRTTSSPNGIVTHNSIYAFRGADIRNILEFERDFPDTRVIALEQNYRSTNTILAAANAVISHNRERKEKNLWSELGEGELVHVVETEDEHAEARFVAAEIAALIDGGYSAAEIAVVYRTNAQSRVLEDVLVRQGIDYQVIGGPRFYERAEIKDAVAYLQVLDNPYDAVSAPADREPAAARDRRHLAGAAAGLRGRARHLALGGDRASRGGRPRAGVDTRGQGIPQRDGVAARDGERLDRRRAGRGSPRSAPAISRRSRRSGRSKRAGGSRTSRSSSASRASTTARRRSRRSPGSCRRSRCTPTRMRSAATRTTRPARSRC